MKRNLNALFDTAPANSVSHRPPQASEPESLLRPVIAEVQRAVSELAKLKQAMAGTHQHVQSARREIESLQAANAILRKKTIRLARMCAQARHFAYHDELTGLPNRSLLLDRLKQALVQSARKHKRVALLFIDLDGFKNVNDSLGHEAGDRLLQQVAQRLVECVRYGDTVCRYGGDEFVIMLPEVDGRECAAPVTEKIRIHLTGTYAVAGSEVAITASIGIAVNTARGQNGAELIKEADAAMYVAKARCQQNSSISL